MIGVRVLASTKEATGKAFAKASNHSVTLVIGYSLAQLKVGEERIKESEANGWRNNGFAHVGPMLL